jgi:hypothetical protein
VHFISSGKHRKGQRKELTKRGSLIEDTPRDAAQMHFAYIYIILLILIRLSKIIISASLVFGYGILCTSSLKKDELGAESRG